MTCFVYVAPCAWEDLLKVGHSRDPLARLEAFHRRWYETFDPDLAWLVELDRVREAAALELALRRRLAERKITLELSDEAKKMLADRGYDPVFGARPLKRTIQRTIENQLALEVLAGRILAWRAERGPFSSVDELGEIQGIGDALMGDLAPLVTV